MLYDYLITAFKVIVGLLSSGSLTAMLLVFVCAYLIWVCLALVFSFQRKFYKNTLNLFNYLKNTQATSIKMEILDDHIKATSKGFWYGWNKFKSAKYGKPSDYIKRSEVLDVEINGGIQNQGKSIMKAYINFVVLFLSLLSFAYYGSTQTLTLATFAESLIVPLFTYLILKIFYFLYTSIKQQLYRNDIEAYYEVIDMLDSKFDKGEPKLGLVQEEEIVQDDEQTQNEDDEQEDLEPQEVVPQKHENPLDEYDIFKKKNIDVEKILNEIPSSSNSTPYIDVDSDYVIKDDEKDKTYIQRSFNEANNGSDVLGGMLQNTQGTKKSTFVDLEKPVAKIDNEKVEQILKEEDEKSKSKSDESAKNDKVENDHSAENLSSSEEKRDNLDMNDSIFDPKSPFASLEEFKVNDVNVASTSKKSKVEVNFNNNNKNSKIETTQSNNIIKDEDQPKKDLESDEEDKIKSENIETSKIEENDAETSDKAGESEVDANVPEIAEQMQDEDNKAEQQESAITVEQNDDEQEDNNEESQPEEISSNDQNNENLGMTNVLGKAKKNHSKLASGGMEIVRNDDASKFSGGEIYEKSSKQIDEISKNSTNIQTVKVIEPISDEESVVGSFSGETKNVKNFSSRPEIQYNNSTKKSYSNANNQNYNNQINDMQFNQGYGYQYPPQDPYYDQGYDVNGYGSMQSVQPIGGVVQNGYNPSYSDFNMNNNQNGFMQDYESDYQPMGPIEFQDETAYDAYSANENFENFESNNVENIVTNNKTIDSGNLGNQDKVAEIKNDSEKKAKNSTKKVTKSKNKSNEDEEDMGKRGRPKNQVIDESYVIKNDKEFDEVLSRAEKLMRKSEEGLSQSQSKRIEKELKILMDAMNKYKEKK